jgi:biopolymer transport protein ExbD
MNSTQVNPQKGTRLIPTISLALFALVLTAAPVSLGQTMQKGVSVDMAPTSNAQPMPAADQDKAWVVSVSSDGRLFFRADPVTRAALVDEMIRTPRIRNENIYIKADARAPYSDVQYVLKAAHTAEFDAPVLLTAQPESSQPGALVPPKGLEVSLESGAIVGPKPAEIEMSTDSEAVKLNNQEVSLADLQRTLTTLFRNQTEKTVLLKADGTLPFAQVVRAIDACRSTGAKVILTAPQA